MSTTLRMGDRGPDVKQLQLALKGKGFNPGEPDGDFGVATEQALIGFQKSRNLLADGVAGPRTQEALELAADSTLPDATTGMSVQIAAQMCPGAPLANIKTHLPVVLQSLADGQLHDRPMVLMAIATIRVETAGFLPISEGQSRFNTSPSGQPFDLYDFRSDLGNHGKGDGERFKGRGFIQLTGRSNYQEFGPKLKPALDLEAHPELANAAQVAADLLALFLGSKERQIKQALLRQDYAEARRLVNGGHHGVDHFTQAFKTGDALMP